MPCHGPSDEEMQSYFRSEKNRYGHLSKGEMEAVICGLLRTGKVTLEDVDWSEAGVARKWIEQWWADHQKQDAASHDPH